MTWVCDLEASGGPGSLPFSCVAFLLDCVAFVHVAKVHMDTPFLVTCLIQGLDPDDAPRFFEGGRLTPDDGLDVPCDLIDLCENGVFPDPDHAPVLQLQFEGLADIALDILTQLVGPELHPASRSDIVVRASMPETPIDEDRHLLGGEYHIWTSCGRLCLEPIPQPQSPQSRPQDPLWFRVGPSDTGHLL